MEDAIGAPDDLTHGGRDRPHGLLEAAALGSGGRKLGTSHRSEVSSPLPVLAGYHRVQCGPIGCVEADHNHGPLRGDRRAGIRDKKN